MKKTNHVTVGFCIEPETRAKLAELAKKEGRSLSAYIRFALTRHIQKARKK